MSGAPAWFRSLAVFFLVVPQQGVHNSSMAAVRASASSLTAATARFTGILVCG